MLLLNNDEKSLLVSLYEHIEKYCIDKNIILNNFFDEQFFLSLNNFSFNIEILNSLNKKGILEVSVDKNHFKLTILGRQIAIQLKENTYIDIDNNLYTDAEKSLVNNIPFILDQLDNKINGLNGIKNLKVLTQLEYDNLETILEDTVYIIRN